MVPPSEREHLARRATTVISPAKRMEIEQGRKKARSNGKTVKVKAHDRVVYRLGGDLARVARWEEIDRLVTLLAKKHDRHGYSFKQFEKRMADRLSALLTDTFR